ncbi:hypothetical protein NUU61_001271 [Penicillium alfredii]|uniref:Uncharacterized protein n=1 Tax=Penicillium alfredii TaxID=1506179 RepID=A0A9W9GBJ9_9EURO|nr:uncharacterized protein NUU61_001271 [Penicillium alfredii]KAJ5115512.1 hypothetical protein NUU61_001271 [Penicillium alfredii]
MLYSVAVAGAGITTCQLNEKPLMILKDSTPESSGLAEGILGPALLVSLSWTLGMVIRPILSGYLTEQVGYFEMNSVLGASSPFRVAQKSVFFLDANESRQRECVHFVPSSPSGA